MSVDTGIKEVKLPGESVARLQYVDTVVHRHKKAFLIRAKPYPADTYDPVSGIFYKNQPYSNRFSRSWHILRWDPYYGIWTNTFDDFGARDHGRDTGHPHPMLDYWSSFDTWNSDIRNEQITAFNNTYDALNVGDKLLIVGSHAPEHISASMRDRIVDCGGTRTRLEHDGARFSYILYGEKGIGSGNGQYEVVNNISYNGYDNCAEITIVI